MILVSSITTTIISGTNNHNPIFVTQIQLGLIIINPKKVDLSPLNYLSNQGPFNCVKLHSNFALKWECSTKEKEDLISKISKSSHNEYGI